MSIMPCRYDILTYLVSMQSTVNTYPGTIGDDLGIHYAVPFIAYWLQVSVDTAIAIFLVALLGLPMAVGTYFLFRYYPLWQERCMVILGMLALVLVCWRIGDTYIAYASSLIVAIPFTLYVCSGRLVTTSDQQKIHQKLPRWTLAAFFLMGIFLGLLQEVRGYAWFSSFVFMVLSTRWLARWSWRQCFLLIALLVSGFVLPRWCFAQLHAKRDAYVRQQTANGNQAVTQHLLWHSLYLGFGFLTNEFDIRYEDSCGDQHARAIDANAAYPTERYEQVIKQELFNLIHHHPGFVIKTIFAKLGIVFLYLLIFANLGLLAAILWPKPVMLDLIFFFTLAASSVFGILVMPTTEYLLGFIAAAIMYGIVSINYALRMRSASYCRRKQVHH